MLFLCVILQQTFVKFILDWKLLQMENFSDMNYLAKDKFPVSNLSVYFPVRVDKKVGQKTSVRFKTLLVKITTSFRCDFKDSLLSFCYCWS